MASAIAIPALGAILNAAAFTGGNYLAKYLSAIIQAGVLFPSQNHGEKLRRSSAIFVVMKFEGWNAAGTLQPATCSLHPPWIERNLSRKTPCLFEKHMARTLPRRLMGQKTQK